MGTKQMGTRPGPLIEVEEARVPLPTREPLDWRVRVSALWVVLAVSMVSAFVLFLVEPGALEDVMAGEVDGEKITEAMTLIFAGFILIPLAMAFLALVLPDTPNRWVNGVVAAIFVVMDAFDLIGHLSDGKFGGEALMMVATVVAGLLIVWYAWRSRVEVRSP